MIGQCFKCGGWHTNPHSCPNTMSNHEASAPLVDWRDAEIERLRGLLAEAERQLLALALNTDTEQDLAKAQTDAKRFLGITDSADAT